MFLSREVSEVMSETMCANLNGTTSPRNRFFTPRRIFWDHLKFVRDTFNIKVLVDCGTGNGDLPIEAKEEGFAMTGVDVVRREGNSPIDVWIIPAHKLPYKEDIWPMVCRPDHSGWVYPLAEKAMYEKSGFIYVGLKDNMEQDLENLLFMKHTTYENVGLENEDMLVWNFNEL